MTAHQVCSQRRIALEVAVGEAIFDRDVAAFNTGRDRLSRKQLLGMTDATAGVHCGARRCGMVACAGSIPLDVGPSDHPVAGCCVRGERADVADSVVMIAAPL